MTATGRPAMRPYPTARRSEEERKSRVVWVNITHCATHALCPLPPPHPSPQGRRNFLWTRWITLHSEMIPHLLQGTQRGRRETRTKKITLRVMHNVGHLDTLYVSCGVWFRKWELSVVVLHMREKTKDRVSAWDSCGGRVWKGITNRTPQFDAPLGLFHIGTKNEWQAATPSTKVLKDIWLSLLTIHWC